MDRGKPLQRRTGLNPGKSLERRTELPRGSSQLARGAPLARSVPMPRQRASTDPQSPSAGWQRSTGDEIPHATRLAVREREGDRCARCGRPLRAGLRQTQHRCPRGAGGRANAHRLSALVLLCGWTSTDPDGCHHRVESYRDEARAAGFLVPAGMDPLEWPVVMHDGIWLLDDEGGRTLVDFMPVV